MGEDERQTTRALAITILRGMVLKRSLEDLERMVDEALENPSCQLARDMQALGVLPPEPDGFEPERKP